MPYTDSLAHYYDLSTPVALPDLGVVGGNPGTGANIASNPVGIHGNSRCAEFNGNNSNYNLGDVAELNAVTAFTIAFWMRQDVLASFDRIFWKYDDVNNNIFIFTLAGPIMRCQVVDGIPVTASFDYSTVVSAGQWHHVAWVFDGSGVGNADRLMCYVDATPVALGYVGTIPATTANLLGIDAIIGDISNSFDGLLDAFAIFSAPLTNLQVTDHMLATRQERL